jgi:sugar diacid utilization regulator
MDKYKQRIFEALVDNLGIHKIIAIGTEAIGNPFYFIDASYRLIAYSDLPHFTHPAWMQMVQRGFIDDPEVILNLHGFRSKLDNQIELLHLENPKHQAYHGKVSIKDQLIGFFGCVDYVHPFNEQDEQFIQFVLMAIQVQMQKSPFYQNPHDQHINFFLIDLLKSPLDEDSIKQRQKSLKLGFDKYITQLVLHKEDQITFAYDLIRKELEYRHKNLHCILHDQNIILFIHHTEVQLNLNILEDILQVAKKYDLVCLHGLAYTQLSDSLTHYEALQYLLKQVHPYEYILHLEDHLFKVNKYLLIHKNVQLMDPVLKKLQEYDEDHHSELVNTLLKTVENGFNQAKTARALNIHYNTILYRLDLMRKITELEISEKKMLDLYCLYQLMKS